MERTRNRFDDVQTWARASCPYGIVIFVIILLMQCAVHVLIGNWIVFALSPGDIDAL
jgi:hypothetical protein